MNFPQFLYFLQESNNIEGVSTLGSVLEEYFIDQGKAPAGTFNKYVIGTMEAFYFVVENYKRVPTIPLICTLHGILMKDIHLNAGVIRKVPVRIVSRTLNPEYLCANIGYPEDKKRGSAVQDIPQYNVKIIKECPKWEEVRTLLRHWLTLWEKKPYKSWTKKKACLHRHYHFEYIHPFSDGNGRVGRLLLLWDTLHSNTTLDVIQSSNRREYYNKINEYKKVKDSYKWG